MKTNRGDVVRVLFPNSDRRTAKRRPALVIQSDRLKTGLAQTIIAMITSNLVNAQNPSRVLVLKSSPEGQQSGLRLDSVIMTDNLATILETEIDSVLGALPQQTMVDVSDALRHTLEL
ncbi:MAG: type II toxin-antitoxin system PemK/MazF family toxin [Acidobacteria bacterium]|nr:type II toxin-antitoxin system PemK/MazF family toxin [Acidobacteriota bacterium]